MPPDGFFWCSTDDRDYSKEPFSENWLFTLVIGAGLIAFIAFALLR